MNQKSKLFILLIAIVIIFLLILFSAPDYACVEHERCLSLDGNVEAVRATYSRGLLDDGRYVFYIVPRGQAIKDDGSEVISVNRFDPHAEEPYVYEASWGDERTLIIRSSPVQINHFVDHCYPLETDDYRVDIKIEHIK